jgi:hypothetical protein
MRWDWDFPSLPISLPYFTINHYMDSVMANTLVYTSAGIAFILIVLLFLVAWIQNSVSESRLLATPSIPKENAVLTSFASARISAPADDVFKAMLSYKDYSKWSCFSQYTWQETTEDGAPSVGSKGSFKVGLDFFDFMLRSKCTVLPFWHCSATNASASVFGEFRMSNMYQLEDNDLNAQRL